MSDEVSPTERQEDLRLGADVYSADGKHVGHLRRILIDDPEFKAEAIVVNESRLFSGHLLSPGSMLLADELIVPLSAIASATHKRVDLRLTAEAVRKLPPYLTFHFAQPTKAQRFQEQLALLGGPVIPGITEEAAKPPTEIEVDPGENVMLGSTGKKLGHVKEVLIQDGQLVGVVVQPVGFLQHHVILPRRFLARGDDLALFAQLSEEDLRQLKPLPPAG